MSERDANRGPGMVACTAVLYALAIVTVFLRVWSRKTSKAGLWWDDWLAISALILGAGELAIVVIAVNNGMGRHIYAVGFEALPTTLKVIWASEPIYTMNIGLAKLSICMLYWRIFGWTKSYLRVALPFLTCLVVLWTIGTVWRIRVDLFRLTCLRKMKLITSLVQCHPVSSFWDFTEHGYCISMIKSCWGTAIPDVITDALLIVTPLPRLLKLQMPTVPKVGITFAFVLGGLTIVASIVRLVESLSEFEATEGPPDVTWSSNGIFVWSSIECNLSIISANIPSLGGLAKNLGQRIIDVTSSLRRSRQSTYKSSMGKQSKFSEL